MSIDFDQEVKLLDPLYTDSAFVYPYHVTVISEGYLKSNQLTLLLLGALNKDYLKSNNFPLVERVYLYTFIAENSPTYICLVTGRVFCVFCSDWVIEFKIKQDYLVLRRWHH